MKWVFCVIIICLSCHLVIGQTESNPFELSDRPKKTNVSPNLRDSTLQKKIDQSNPFEVTRNRNSNELGTNALPKLDHKIELPRFPENGPVPHFFLGLVILILLGLLAALNTIFKTDLRNGFKAFTNENILKLLHREQKDVAKGSFLMLYLFYVICMGLFLFLLGNYFGVLPKGKWMMLLCIVFVGIIWVARHLILYIIGSVFPFDKEISLYSYTISIFNHVLGMVMLPFVIFIAFSPNEFRFIPIYIAMVVIGLFYLYRVFRGLLVASKFLSFHKFHFFVYLCTIEIAPVLIVIKLIMYWGSML